MNAEQLIELQNKIVAAIAKGVSRPWDAVVVNIEIDEIDGDPTENCLCLSFVSPQPSMWERHSFELPYECFDFFVALRQSADIPWKSCTLQIAPNGKYRFAYSHDMPRRLNGILDDQAMLKQFIPKPL